MRSLASNPDQWLLVFLLTKEGKRAVDEVGRQQLIADIPPRGRPILASFRPSVY